MRKIKILIVALPVCIIISPLMISLFFVWTESETVLAFLTVLFNILLPFIWLSSFIIYFVKQKITQNNYWFFIISLVLLLPMSFVYLSLTILLSLGDFGP